MSPRTSIMFAALALSMLMTGRAEAVGTSQIPVNGNAPTPQGQGNTQIGTISVDDNDGMGGGISATFTLDPNYRFLDEWYNFRWINIVTSYTINGMVQDNDNDNNPDAPIPSSGNEAELPAIDPQPGPCAGCPGFNDGAPFYFTNAEHAACMDQFGPCGMICVPNMSSSWCDNRANHPANTVITFETYLVAESDTDPEIDGMTLCVLAGFEWTYTENTGAQEQTQSIPNPLDAHEQRIDTALANANAPGFAGWDAVLGCTFSACETFGRVATLPRYVKSYTITSYKYTNHDRGLEWEVLNKPVQVESGKGDPVTLENDVPFNPDDLHISYSWENSPFPTNHTIFIAEKGGTFTWRWYCLKQSGTETYACLTPQQEETVCQLEHDCVGGEPCAFPYVLGPGDEVFGDLAGGGGIDAPLGGAIPAVSSWGVATMLLLTLTLGTLAFRKTKGLCFDD